MSRTFTKLFLAVVMLLGILNTAFADKYKATMTFSGNASGESKNVDAEITDTDGGYKAITFTGFNVSTMMTGDLKGISASIVNLFYDQGSDNSLTLRSCDKSRFEITDYSLPLSNFSTEIDGNGDGKGSFTCSVALGPISQIINCSFTLKKFVDTDTIVTKEIEINDVPFYNKVVDLNKAGDTTNTNNDSTAVGIRLFGSKAEFAMTDYEISVANLKLKQTMLLENLTWAKNKTTEDILISGNTTMAIEMYNNMTVPANANIIVSKDGVINGTIDITVNMMTFNYQITVIFGKQAEGVVIETKLLEYDYDKADLIPVKSDQTFMNDTLIFINENGILIDNIQYSIVDQKMTLLIKEYEKSAPLLADSMALVYDESGNIVPLQSPILIYAKKAEAYITVKGEVVYLKDIDIDLDLRVLESKAAFGSLTILDGGPATNEFLDPEGPIVFAMVGRNITMTVDTTGYGLDGYSEGSEFNVSGIYDQADGYIKTVKLVDFAAAMNAAISEAKDENGHGFEVEVVATDKAGNSTKFKTTCYANVAPVKYNDVKIPTISPIRVVADSLTNKATIKFESMLVNYTIVNEDLNLSKTVAQSPVWIEIAGERIELPSEVEFEIGKTEVTWVWEDIINGKVMNSTTTITVYASDSTMANVSNVASKAVSVIYKDGNLIVNGANDANVTIVSISGSTVYTGKAGAINLHKGIYIVKVDGKAHKVVVK